MNHKWLTTHYGKQARNQIQLKIVSYQETLIVVQVC